MKPLGKEKHGFLFLWDLEASSWKNEENINVEAVISHQPGCGLLYPSLGKIGMNEMPNNFTDSHAIITQRQYARERGWICVCINIIIISFQSPYLHKESYNYRHCSVHSTFVTCLSP